MQQSSVQSDFNYPPGPRIMLKIHQTPLLSLRVGSGDETIPPILMSPPVLLCYPWLQIDKNKEKYLMEDT